MPSPAPTDESTLRLYYYTSRHWGLKALWEKRLKISEYKDVNDPFELYPFSRTKHHTPKFEERYMATLAASPFGRLCFSEDWRTTLMWSHYAEKHTGLCLGFDVPRDAAKPVVYVDRLLDEPADRKVLTKGVPGKELEDALLHKYAGWSYEREWRMRVRLGRASGGLYFEPFSDQLHLREVIIGARSDLHPSDVATAVNNPPLDVDIFVARSAFGAFEVCRHERVSTHTAKGYRAALKQLKDLYADEVDDL